MPETLALRHPGGTTRLLVGDGAVAAAGGDLGPWLDGRLCFLVTTRRVWELHGPSLSALIAPALRIERLEVEEGEAAKTIASAERLWRRMLAAGGKRDSRLLSFGGGSVGDLGGFVAGAFLRGIACVQLPTTLLAQVDAAIGGKTAVDLPEGKNTVGLFHHPDLVVADASWLATLPRRELAAGLVEAVKMGFLLDPPLCEEIAAGLDRLLAGEPAALGPVVTRAAAAKIRVVERDPEEAGERQLLNFGHTLGHALEAAAGYEGLRHGEAVAYGMLFALRLARRRGLPLEDATRLRGLLSRLELPPLPPAHSESLLALVARDKKARREGLTWVLARRLGEGERVTGLDEGLVRDELTAFVRDPWAVES